MVCADWSVTVREAIAVNFYVEQTDDGVSKYLRIKIRKKYESPFYQISFIIKEKMNKLKVKLREKFDTNIVIKLNLHISTADSMFLFHIDTIKFYSKCV